MIPLTSVPRDLLELVSPALFSWRADPEVGLDALTGQAATFTRAGDRAALLDSLGASYTALHSMPAWQWTSDRPGLYLSSAATADALSFTFAALPQAMTIYAQLVERGTAAAADARLWEIGNGSDPRLLVYAPSGAYALLHGVGAATRSSTAAAAPTVGQVVELRAVVLSTGAVYLGQSIAGAAEVVAATSTALAFGAAWSGATLTVNADGAGANKGVTELRRLLILPGEQTLVTCRATL